MRAKSLNSCLTLCDPMDCSPPGSSVQGALQARRLEWVAASSSLPDPGIEPAPLTPLTPPALAGGFFITSTTWEALGRHFPNSPAGENRLVLREYSNPRPLKPQHQTPHEGTCAFNALWGFSGVGWSVGCALGTPPDSVQLTLRPSRDLLASEDAHCQLKR